MSLGRYRRGFVAVGALALAAATGCSIPVDDVARPIDDAPVDLLAVTTTTPEVVPEEEVEFVISLYFYDDLDQLVEVKRPTEESPPLVDVLAALVANTPEEQEEIPGIGTRLLADGSLRLVEADTGGTGIATVSDDTNLYRDLQADRLQRVYSQIVCTLTKANSELFTVQIVDEQGPIPVQSLLDASVIEGPVDPVQLNDCRTAADIEAEAVAAAEEDAEATEEDG